MSFSQIKVELDLPVTSRRIQQVLSSTANVKWKKPSKKPALKPHNKHARLEFARKYMDMGKNWNHVVFSDEKKFNLDGPDG